MPNSRRSNKRSKLRKSKKSRKRGLQTGGAAAEPEIGIIGIGVSEKIGTLTLIGDKEKKPPKDFLLDSKDAPDNAFISIYDKTETKKFELLNIIFKKAYFVGSSEHYVILKKQYRNMQELIVSFFLLKHLKKIGSITYDDHDIKELLSNFVIHDLLTDDNTKGHPEYFPGFRKLTNYSNHFPVNDDSITRVDSPTMTSLSNILMGIILNYSVVTSSKKLISFIGVGAGYLTSLSGKSGASGIFYGSITPYKTEYGDYIAKNEYEDCDDADKLILVYSCMTYKDLNSSVPVKTLQENMVNSLKVASCPLRSSLYARAAARNAEITL